MFNSDRRQQQQQHPEFHRSRSAAVNSRVTLTGCTGTLRRQNAVSPPSSLGPSPARHCLGLGLSPGPSPARHHQLAVGTRSSSVNSPCKSPRILSLKSSPNFRWYMRDRRLNPASPAPPLLHVYTSVLTCTCCSPFPCGGTTPLERTAALHSYTVLCLLTV